MDVVDPSDGRPEFILSGPRRREGGLFAGVGSIPGIGDDRLRRVRRVFQYVVLFVCPAGFHRFDFSVNGDHRLAKPIELFL